MSFIADLFDKGGVLIYPLLGLLLWAIGIIIYKGLTLRRRPVINSQVVAHVEQLLIGRDVTEATVYCKQSPVPMPRILLAGIINYEKSEAELKEILEEARRQEMPAIRSHLTALGTIASVAPLLGLLGTVIGMISVFAIIWQESSTNPSMLAGGISEALVTTAVGMVIAVPALAFHNFFINRLQHLVVEMERISLRMVVVLKRV